jgi:hypothetical protein
MDPHRSKAVGFWNTSGTADLTKAATAARRHVLTHISGSSDAAATVTVESPSGTTKWRKTFGSAFTFSETFPPGEFEMGVNEAIILKISAGTKTYNMAGYDVQG